MDFQSNKRKSKNCGTSRAGSPVEEDIHEVVYSLDNVIGEVQEVADVLFEGGGRLVALVLPVLLHNVLLEVAVEPRLGHRVGDLARVGGDDSVKRMPDHQKLGGLFQQLLLELP